MFPVTPNGAVALILDFICGAYICVTNIAATMNERGTDYMCGAHAKGRIQATERVRCRDGCCGARVDGDAPVSFIYRFSKGISTAAEAPLESLPTMDCKIN